MQNIQHYEGFVRQIDNFHLQDIQFIFSSLDTDGSGRIEREEFLGGFQSVLCKGENAGKTQALYFNFDIYFFWPLHS